MRRLYVFLIIVLSMTMLFSFTSVAAEDSIKTEHFSHYVVDYESGEVLSSYNEDDRHEIASMVKIMTLNIIFDEIDRGKITLGDSVTISKHAASVGGSELFIDAGACYTISDLIKGVIVVSANDAATALAEHIANSDDRFVDMMNNKAEEWGLSNTHFVNVTGLPKDGQYSSAKDVSIMTSHLLEHEELYNYSKIWTEDYIHPSGRVTNLTNTNKLVRFYDGCDAGKTGYTDKAGYCLSASAKRNNMRIIATVIGAKTSKERFYIASSLMNTAFNDYEYMLMKKAGEGIENNIMIRHARSKKLPIAYASDVKVLAHRGGEQGEIAIEYNLPSYVVAPIKKNTVIGHCHVISDGKKSKDVDIIVTEDVSRDSIWGNLKGLNS